MSPNVLDSRQRFKKVGLSHSTVCVWKKYSRVVLKITSNKRMSSTLEKILNKAKNEGKTLDMSTVAYTLGYAAGKKMETKMGTLIFLFRKRRRRNDA